MARAGGRTLSPRHRRRRAGAVRRASAPPPCCARDRVPDRRAGGFMPAASAPPDRRANATRVRHPTYPPPLPAPSGLIASPSKETVKDTGELTRPLSGERGPAAVGIAAGRAACGLRPAIDVDGLGVGAAVAAAILVGRPGHDRAVAARVGIAPGDRRAGRTALKRFHLGGIGPAVVFFIERRADAVADQGANAGADQRAGNMAARAAAELRADRRAAERTEQRARVLLRSGPGLRIACTTGKRCGQTQRDEKPRSGRANGHVMTPKGETAWT